MTDIEIMYMIKSGLVFLGAIIFLGITTSINESMKVPRVFSTWECWKYSFYLFGTIGILFELGLFLVFKT